MSGIPEAHIRQNSMKKIELLPYIDVNNVSDNQDVYNVVSEKINELIERANGHYILDISSEQESKIKELLKNVLKPESSKEPYVTNIIQRILRVLDSNL